MRVPPCIHTLETRVYPRKAGGWTDLGKPAANVVPANAHNITTLEAAPAGVVASTVEEERAITEAQVLDKVLVADLYLHCGDVATARLCIFNRLIATHEALVSFAHNPHLASSAQRERSAQAESHNEDHSLENASLDDGAHGRIHACAVAAGSENGDLHRARR
jgi:hypothetical protein